MANWTARESAGPGKLVPELKRQFVGVYIANEGFSLEAANRAIAASEAGAVLFGKLFIANPDLPKRFPLGAPLNKPDPSTFYGSGPSSYTNYPALDDSVATADGKGLAVILYTAARATRDRRAALRTPQYLVARRRWPSARRHTPTPGRMMPSPARCGSKHRFEFAP